MSHTRPSTQQWIRYVFTSRLPERYDEWVLRDVTGPTWLLRHIARFFIQLSPIGAAVLIFLPTPFIIRVGCLAAGILASVCFSFGYVVEMADHRAENAGYPRGLAESMREQRSQRAQRESAARRRAKTSARLTRH